MSATVGRKLIVIVYADMVGYSRLIGLDDAGTLRRLRTLRRALIDPAIREHGGRVVQTAGDSLLMVFDSIDGAVRCSLKVQQQVPIYDGDQPSDRRIRFRVGINIGDAIAHGTDLHGDSVNIAARLEAECPEGGICVSRAVRDHVHGRLDLAFEAIGSLTLKNIARPVEAFVLRLDPAAQTQAPRVAADAAQAGTRVRRRTALFAGILGLLAVGAGGAGWWLHRDNGAAPKVPAATWAALVNPASTPVTAQAIKAAAEGLSKAARPAAPPAPSTTAIQQPQMVSLPGGRFQMGSHDDRSEEPVHFVQVRPFWIGKYPVTVAEWEACVAAGGCKHIPDSTHGPDQPMTNVSWLDAMSYVQWLARASGVPYRLPSEAEWEYAARGGSMTRYWWGNEVEMGHADCRGCSSSQENAGPLKVGSFASNRFGLFDMGGDVAEWVADCWHANYAGASTDGAAWECQNGGDHVLRGGSWMSTPNIVRASDREHYETSVRYPGNGFRLARSK